MKINQQRKLVLINQDAALQEKALAMLASLSCPETKICNRILETVQLFFVFFPCLLGVIF